MLFFPISHLILVQAQKETHFFHLSLDLINHTKESVAVFPVLPFNFLKGCHQQID